MLLSRSAILFILFFIILDNKKINNKLKLTLNIFKKRCILLNNAE